MPHRSVGLFIMNRLRVVTTASTGSGTVPAGASSIGFSIGVGGVATINANIPLSSALPVLNLPLLTNGFYPAISYTVTSGTLYIVEIRE